MDDNTLWSLAHWRTAELRKAAPEIDYISLFNIVIEAHRFGFDLVPLTVEEAQHRLRVGPGPEHYHGYTQKREPYFIAGPAGAPNFAAYATTRPFFDLTRPSGYDPIPPPPTAEPPPEGSSG